MSFNIFAKTFSQLFDLSMSLKIHCDAKYEVYTCTIEWKLGNPLAHPTINVPMEFMKELINYMKIMYGILDKNQGLIIDQNMDVVEQAKAFSVLMYLDFEMLILTSIIVAPIGHTLCVGLHYKDVKGNVSNIYLSIGELNALSIALDEAEQEINKLEVDLKKKRKVKTESLVQPCDIEDLIYDKIEKKCGRFFK